jgi:hypothetical protein
MSCWIVLPASRELRADDAPFMLLEASKVRAYCQIAISKTHSNVRR